VLSDPVDLLDCAPIPALTRRLVALPNVRYVSVDLESSLAAVKADLMELPFPSQSFDVVLCSHVLEHVADDRRAMRELARVLRHGGFAAIVVPLHGGLSHTLEDPSVTTPEQRLNTYGQADHVRLYGRDFPTRLMGSGFAVERVSMFESLSQEEVARWGLSPYDDIYICRPR
jgi:SAM-dependent methyltransferase